MKCDRCKMESEHLEEVCFYDINGYAISTTGDIERNLFNPDALAHKFCPECADIYFNFTQGIMKTEENKKMKDKYLEKVITTQYKVDNHMFSTLKINQITKIANEQLAINIARELMKNDYLEVEEQYDHSCNSKVFRFCLVPLTKKDYIELKRKAEAFDKMNEIVKEF